MIFTALRGLVYVFSLMGWRRLGHAWGKPRYPCWLTKLTAKPWLWRDSRGTTRSWLRHTMRSTSSWKRPCSRRPRYVWMVVDGVLSRQYIRFLIALFPSWKIVFDGSQLLVENGLGLWGMQLIVAVCLSFKGSFTHFYSWCRSLHPICNSFAPFYAIETVISCVICWRDWEASERSSGLAFGERFPQNWKGLSLFIVSRWWHNFPTFKIVCCSSSTPWCLTRPRYDWGETANLIGR